MVIRGAIGAVRRLQKNAFKVTDAIFDRSPVAAITRSARRTTTLSTDLEVQTVITETHRSRTLVLRPVGGGRLKAFRAGQYLHISLDIAGEEHSRSYSISSREGQDLQLTVKAVDGGLVSQHLVHHVGPGDVFSAKGPAGRFVLPESENDSPLCFLAAGSGITPIFSMISTALAAEPKRQIRLVYSNRDSQDTIFADALRELASVHSGFEIIEVHSRPGAGWNGHRGRLTGERAVDLLEPTETAHVFLCGPPELMQETCRVLQERGIAADRIHKEVFARRTHEAPPDASAASDEPRVTWTQSGILDRQRPGETLLTASQRVNANVAYICESGECGSCMVKVLSGEVVHEPDTCLTAEQTRAGYVLACSSYARNDVTLEA
jgi:ferredoxin-NADP reductase